MKREERIMQQFTGTKTVMACKMSRKSAEEIIGRKMRADSDEIEDENGYLVRYPDGYESWSPAMAFKEAYRPSETHVDRMIIEKEEVEKRYLAGRKFTFSAKFATLSEDQRVLLRKQLDQMESYLYTLTKRIGIENEIEIMNAFHPICGDGSPAEPLREKHD